MTTTTLPITITIEVTGTFVPGNLHKVRDEEPQGDTFDDIEITYIANQLVDIADECDGLTELASVLLQEHRDEIIEALLAERSKSAP